MNSTTNQQRKVQQGIKIDVWDDHKNYKNCKKKIFDAAVCKPPVNTVVINKVLCADVVKSLGGREYFTADEVVKMQTQNPQKFALLQSYLQSGKAYVVNSSNPFVLAGTLGELSTIRGDKLSAEYGFIGGSGEIIPITTDSLGSRSMQNGLLGWTRVRSKISTFKEFACFVPINTKGRLLCGGLASEINQGKGYHGKGDFIVCDAYNGSPMFARRRVVKGDIFATTYSNQGWTDCINSNMSSTNIVLDSLPKLVLNSPKQDDNTGISMETFKNKVNTLVKELQSKYKFNVDSINFEETEACLRFETYLWDKCYVASVYISGDFRKSVIDLSNNYTPMKFDQVCIYFGCSGKFNDSAITMKAEIIRGRGKYDFYGKVSPEHWDSDTYCIPHDATVYKYSNEVRAEDGKGKSYYKCKSEGFNSINCSEEINYFSEHAKKADIALIDNREKSVKAEKSLIGLLEKRGYFSDRDRGGYYKDNSDILVDVKVINQDALSRINVGEYFRHGNKTIHSLKTWFNKSEAFIEHNSHSWALCLLECITDRVEDKERIAEVVKLMNSKNMNDAYAFSKNKMTTYDKYTLVGIKHKGDKNYYYATAIKYKYIDFILDNGEQAIFVISYTCHSMNMRFEAADAFGYIFTESELKSDNNDGLYALVFGSPIPVVKNDVEGRLLTEDEKLEKLRNSLWEQLGAHAEYFDSALAGEVSPEYKYAADDIYEFYKRNNAHLAVLRRNLVATLSKSSIKYAQTSYYGVAWLTVLAFVDSLSKLDNRVFFSLHPVKSVSVEAYDEARRFKIILKGGHWLQCVYWDSIKIEYYKGNNVLATYTVTQSDIDSYLDVVERIADKSMPTDPIAISIRTASPLRELGLYHNINRVVSSFIKPRKLSPGEYVSLFGSIVSSFNKVVLSYGLNFIKEGEFNKDASSWRCVIDGDNDNHLRLILSVKSGQEYFGIGIQGKSANKVLNSTSIIVNRDRDDSEAIKQSPEEFTRELMEKVCEVLGVSKYRRFCTVNSPLYSLLCKALGANLDSSKSASSSNTARFILSNFRGTKVALSCTLTNLILSVYTPNRVDIDITNKVNVEDKNISKFVNINAIARCVIEAVVANSNKYLDSFKPVLAECYPRLALAGIPMVIDENSIAGDKPRGDNVSSITVYNREDGLFDVFYAILSGLTGDSKEGIQGSEVYALVDNFCSSVHYTEYH